MASAPADTFGPAAPAALQWQSRAQQLDRFENHAAHCAFCRRALERGKIIRAAALVAAAVVPALGLRRLPALAAMGAALAVCKIADGIVKSIGSSRVDEVPLRSVAAAAK